MDIMKIYIVVYQYDDEGDSIEAVFSTREKAEEYASKLTKTYTDIYEYTLDQEIRNI